MELTAKITKFTNRRFDCDIYLDGKHVHKNKCDLNDFDHTPKNYLGIISLTMRQYWRKFDKN